MSYYIRFAPVRCKCCTNSRASIRRLTSSGLFKLDVCLLLYSRFLMVLARLCQFIYTANVADLLSTFYLTFKIVAEVYYFLFVI